ncbi:hypothetical protein NKR23_g1052 [Pleurostoma richardsiae]|uniref:Uncharacterized protein n=1 Tax=Pleurostoma richardsiae TaxID=41990 RepID=A0AA38VX74_9PEZI|nr:hypothetical protein NKR23_g1052 [Pleurostoma richardsiae]
MSLVPPVSKDGFSYVGDALYVEASGHNRHRRATIPELKAHFEGSSEAKDPPAHWYEAQLIHYGLPPSKVKGTAKMRLFEASIKGTLVVPTQIQKVEGDLKKEWKKREREAKKALKETSGAAKGTKRKASEVVVTAGTNINLNLSLSVDSQGVVQIQTAQPPAKKAKTSKATAKEPATSKTTPKTTKAATKEPAASKTAPKTGKAVAKGPDSSKAKPKTEGPDSTKTTLKRLTAKATASKVTAAGLAKPAAAKPPRTKQTARRGGGAARGRVQPSSGSAAAYDDPPPPYSEVDDGDYPGRGDYDEDGDSGDAASPPTTSPQRRLGLLNGRYKIMCPDLENDFPNFGSDFGLILTLDGDDLWGSFDLGCLTGILQVPRPWNEDVGNDLGTVWRGHVRNEYLYRDYYNQDTRLRCGPGNHLCFLGDGEISGCFRYGRPGSSSPFYHFTGFRVPGQGTRSEISPVSMREQWEDLAP